jgi:hypothetical protein
MERNLVGVLFVMIILCTIIFLSLTFLGMFLTDITDFLALNGFSLCLISVASVALTLLIFMEAYKLATKKAGLKIGAHKAVKPIHRVGHHYNKKNNL